MVLNNFIYMKRELTRYDYINELESYLRCKGIKITEDDLDYIHSLSLAEAKSLLNLNRSRNDFIRLK